MQKLDGTGHESGEGGVVVMELGGKDGDGGPCALAYALQGVGKHGREARKVLFGYGDQVGPDKGKLFLDRIVDGERFAGGHGLTHSSAGSLAQPGGLFLGDFVFQLGKEGRRLLQFMARDRGLDRPSGRSSTRREPR